LKKDSKVEPRFQQNAETESRVMHLVQKLFTEWMKRLRLDYWYFTHVFTTQRDRRFPSAKAYIQFQDEYESGQATWILPELCGMSERDVEETVVHELCHCVIAPLQNKHSKRKEIELMVTRLSRTLMSMKYDKSTPEPTNCM
jgi:hypothetical protein